MKSTREKILRTLLAYPNSSIKALAEEVGINGISIRHHLAALEADNLVTSSEERHGVGRPRLVYSLTEKGAEQFPTSYLRLTHRLLTLLKETTSQEIISDLFSKMGKEIVAEYDFDFGNISDIERLNKIKQILTKEGFIVNWEKEENSFRLKTLSCPYFQIGFEHPEVCNLDYAVISAFFSDPVIIKSCIFEGDKHCTFEIQRNQEKERDS